jgi:dihydrofolate reductase
MSTETDGGRPMRKLIVSEFVSVDGVMEDPGGAESFAHGGWVFAFDRGAEGDRFKLDEVLEADAMLLGRVTYEGFAQAWPDRTDDVGFAEKMNGMPKYVVSSTLKHADWNNSTVINGDVVNEVVKLKEQPGGPILVAGSASLVDTLMEHGLVDELRLMVFPIVLGIGKRLFANQSHTSRLRLTESRQSNDALILIYDATPQEAPRAADVRAATGR